MYLGLDSLLAAWVGCVFVFPMWLHLFCDLPSIWKQRISIFPPTTLLSSQACVLFIGFPHSSLWQVQQTSWSASRCFPGGSHQICHYSWCSPYSRGCTLNSKTVWSIPNSTCQVLIEVMVDFCCCSGQHDLSGLDSYFQKDIPEVRETCLFPQGWIPSEMIFL